MNFLMLKQEKVSINLLKKGIKKHIIVFYNDSVI